MDGCLKRLKVVIVLPLALSLVTKPLTLNASKQWIFFASDWEADDQAEKDGIKIIRDLMLPREHQAPYIDTPENRMLLADLVISDTKEAHNLSENEYHAFLDAGKVVCQVCLKSSEENCAACPVQYTCSRLEKIMEDNYLYDAGLYSKESMTSVLAVETAGKSVKIRELHRL